MSPSDIVERKQAVINALKQAVQAFDLIEQQTARIKELEATMPLYDELLARCAIAEKQRDELLALVKRYRNETPLGHQPYMIADLADATIAKVRP